MLARAEHTEYLQALAAAGLDVEVLPPDERFPDSCFVQDPALVIDGQAIITRMGAPTRRGEEESLGKALEGRFPLPLAWIEAPGTLEGGDVLILPDRVVVGQSERTNKEGIAQLRDILAARDVPVTGVSLSGYPGYLHLLSAVSYLGRGIMLAAAEDLAAHPALRGFEVIIAPPEEVYAVNTLAVGDRVIVPAGFPWVAAVLSERGFEVLSVPMSQFAAADGGVTCLSLVW